jgi:hypothetical protein
MAGDGRAAPRAASSSCAACHSAITWYGRGQEARAHFGLSTSSVTGPSLTSSTCIIAPNTPRAALSRSQKRPYSGSASSGVAVERELAHAQDLPLAERLVHPPGGVGKDAQRPDLGGQPVGVGLAVRAVDAEQHEQPGADRRHPLAVHRHRGPADPLHQRPHRLTPRAARRPRARRSALAARFHPHVPQQALARATRDAGATGL